MDTAQTQEILNLAGLSQIYSQFDVLVNLSLAIVLGLFISYVYKFTHKGVSYSQSFMLTIVFVTIIVAMVMMVIGNNSKSICLGWGFVNYKV